MLDVYVFVFVVVRRATRASRRRCAPCCRWRARSPTAWPTSPRRSWCTVIWQPGTAWSTKSTPSKSEVGRIFFLFVCIFLHYFSCTHSDSCQTLYCACFAKCFSYIAQILAWHVTFMTTTTTAKAVKAACQSAGWRQSRCETANTRQRPTSGTSGTSYCYRLHVHVHL